MTDATRILRRDETVIDTSKGSSRRAKSKSTKLLERSGYISDFGSGLYGLTHLGQETRRRVEQVVRSEHVQNGCVEVSVPSLQYADDWKASGRWETFEGEMFTFTNRDDSDMCLAPTHEEGIVRMFRNSIRSYKQLPLTVFQIKEKHREDKARQGLLRAKEFVMKDAYSLHQNAESMHRRYEEMKAMYRRIFDRLGLAVAEVDADVGVMGGTESMEFVAPSQNGDDELLHCTDCSFGVTDEHDQYDEFESGVSCPDCAGELRLDNGVEVGHIFALGTRYSSKMDFRFDSSNGERTQVYMASYGIGITRAIQTLIEQNGDETSCAWGLDNGFTCSPFDLCIIRGNGIADNLLSQVRKQLSGSDRRCLEYTGEKGIGEQFAESDLIGIPVKIILGNHWQSEGEVEIELHDGRKLYVELTTLRKTLRDVF